MRKIAASRDGEASDSEEDVGLPDSADSRGLRDRLQPAIEVSKTFIGWVKAHERTLSALGMIAGFVSDNLLFRRIDLPNTQVIFGAYLSLAALSIAGLHFLERRAREGRMYARWRALFPMATQFALGGLWSGFLVFYSRSAVLTDSWPYLGLLAGFLIGNELLKAYHSRLVFTTVLFYFGLFSFAIVTLPIYTHTIGRLTFLGSGFAATGALILFLYVLTLINRAQYAAVKGWIGAGVGTVYVLMNVFYFTNTLPPLPLALAKGGIFHAVKKTGDVYAASAESSPWPTWFGAPPVIHVMRGQSIAAYSAVFAPIRLTTQIVHRWRHYDPKTGHWITVSRVAFAINGGRDGGYRGYTVKHNPQAGDWRVDIDTGEGQLIGRIAFRVEAAATPPPVTLQKLK
jgi:hypothetical protein